MSIIQEIKRQKQVKIDLLINEVQMFFAFSNEQFAANRVPLAEGDKYLSLGAGCYMPKSNLTKHQQGIKEVNKWYRNEVKNKDARRDNIIYELNNREAFYTGEIEDTVEALGSDYTFDEVLAVFRAEQSKQEQY